MATTNINIRVDSDLKRAAEELFNDLGMSMSTAITIFLRSSVSNDGIPFEIRRTPNDTTREALAEYYKMLRDPDAYKSYDSFDELMEEVMSDA